MATRARKATADMVDDPETPSPVHDYELPMSVTGEGGHTQMVDWAKQTVNFREGHVKRARRGEVTLDPWPLPDEYKV